APSELHCVTRALQAVLDSLIVGEFGDVAQRGLEHVPRAIFIEHAPDGLGVNAGKEIGELGVRVEATATFAVARVNPLLERVAVAEDHGGWVEQHHAHAVAHRIDSLELVLLAFDLLQADAGAELLPGELSLSNTDETQTVVGFEGNEDQLIDVLLGDKANVAE